MLLNPSKLAHIHNLPFGTARCSTGYRSCRVGCRSDMLLLPHNRRIDLLFLNPPLQPIQHNCFTKNEPLKGSRKEQMAVQEQAIWSFTLIKERSKWKVEKVKGDSITNKNMSLYRSRNSSLT